MIQVANVTKRFSSALAVDNISFTVERGEIVGFLGPNGAGKTTTMRMLTGYLSPTSGSVLINGLDIVAHPLEVRRKIGYLPENVPLYPEMRVDEYLRFRATIKGVSRRKRRTRIEDVKQLCGLHDMGRRIIGHLSRGYLQRIGLADSLVHEPEILILDEPTIGLDPHQIRSIRELITQLGRRYTIVLSTHFLAEAEVTCRRMIIINKGRIVASDTPEHLVGLLKGNTSLVAELLGPCADVVQELERIPTVVRVACHPVGTDAAPVPVAAGAPAEPVWIRYTIECSRGSDIRTQIHELAARRTWKLRELFLERKHMEDVFVAVTAADATENGEER